jgi:hypothetical protein
MQETTCSPFVGFMSYAKRKIPLIVLRALCPCTTGQIEFLFNYIKNIWMQKERTPAPRAPLGGRGQSCARRRLGVIVEVITLKHMCAV